MFVKQNTFLTANDWLIPWSPCSITVYVMGWVEMDKERHHEGNSIWDKPLEKDSVLKVGKQEVGGGAVWAKGRR